MGTILPVNTTAFFPLTDELDENVAVAVTDLNYTQFLSEHFAVFAGQAGYPRCRSQRVRLRARQEPVHERELPLRLRGGAPAALQHARGRRALAPRANVSIKASLINTTDSSTTTGFDDFGDGASASAEAGVQYRLAERPGGMNLGGLYSFDQDFAKVGGLLIFRPGQGVVIPNKDDTWAIYWSAWQYLWVADRSEGWMDLANGVPDREGVGVFTRLRFATRRPIGGMVGERRRRRPRHDPIPGTTCSGSATTTRASRTRGFSATCWLSTATVRVSRRFYNLAITPAAHLSLDLQLQDSCSRGYRYGRRLGDADELGILTGEAVMTKVRVRVCVGMLLAFYGSGALAEAPSIPPGWARAFPPGPDIRVCRSPRSTPRTSPGVKVRVQWRADPTRRPCSPTPPHGPRACNLRARSRPRLAGRRPRAKVGPVVRYPVFEMGPLR